MFTVDVLPVWPLHRVRARVEVEGPWTLTGRAAGRSWQVAEGEGPTWLSDPWAPLGVAVSYDLASGGGTETAGPVVRTYSGRNVLTDLQGVRAVDFMWLRSGGGRREYDTGRHSFFDVPGSPTPAYLTAPSGAGGGSLIARVEGVEANETMDALVLSGKPLILLHNEQACQRRVCDIPRAQTVMILSVGQDLTERSDVAERDWPLAYQLVPSPWGFLPPVATLAEMTERWPTVGDLADSGLTVGELAAGDWLVG